MLYYLRCAGWHPGYTPIFLDNDRFFYMLSPLLGKWTEDMVASVPASCTTGTIKEKKNGT